MHVLVVGAGIGGLTAAATLRRAGHTVSVLEQAPEFAPVGAGLTVQPNALAALASVGLAGPVREAAHTITSAVLRSSRGRVLVDAPVEEAAGDAGLPVVVHRATLHEVLLEAAGPDRVRTGAEVVGAAWDDRGVRVAIEGGEEVTGDVLVGADGIHSRVREALHGPRDPRYAGYTCWRGVVDRDPAWPEIEGEIVGAGRRVGLARMDGDRLYWFAVINAPPGGTDDRSRREILADLFGGFPDPVESMFAATPEDAIRRDDIIDRPVCRTWGEGRVTLLGDAAHAMTPNMGQGACQAIEDAVVLGAVLQDSDPVGSLRRYERLRQDRTAWFVRTSWRFGRVMQWEHPAAVWLRNTGLWLAPRWAARRALRSAWRFELP